MMEPVPRCPGCDMPVEGTCTDNCPNMLRSVIAHKELRILELEDAIRYHAEQNGDDRCFLDDLQLYKLIGITEHPGLALPREQFLSNCSRYWECQQTGKEYKTNPNE